MFTAIVLVCADMYKTIDSCYTYTLSTVSGSYEECVLDIKSAVDQNYFYYFDEMRNTAYQITDFYCVDWKAERS